MSKAPSLLAVRRFLPLFLTQSFGAFNDNVFKNALVMLITYKSVIAMNGGNTQILVTLAAGLFMLPYLLFSATAGQLADKLDRASLARITKIAEILLMGIAAIGFCTDSIYFLLFVLFCMGTQATFFGPIKYALLPQHLHANELLAGNAYIEAGTLLCILSGTIFGGLLIMQPAGNYYISAAIIAIALLGYISSRAIPPAPSATPHLKVNWNIVKETWSMIQHDRKNPRVFRCIMGISWFWLIGATFLSQFPTYAKDVIHSDETVVTLFLTIFSLGIGIGSLLCNRLLKGKVTSAGVPLAAAGLTLFTIDLFFASQTPAQPIAGTLMSAVEFIRYPSSWRILFDLIMISICGGLYVVPLYAIIQHDSDPAHTARTIASNNVLNALFMVAASIITIAMFKANFSVPEVFLSVGIGNGIVVWYIRKLRKPADAHKAN